jgi:hypothetical protein
MNENNNKKKKIPEILSYNEFKLKIKIDSFELIAFEYILSKLPLKIDKYRFHIYLHIKDNKKLFSTQIKKILDDLDELLYYKETKDEFDLDEKKIYDILDFISYDEIYRVYNYLVDRIETLEKLKEKFNHKNLKKKWFKFSIYLGLFRGIINLIYLYQHNKLNSPYIFKILYVNIVSICYMAILLFIIWFIVAAIRSLVFFTPHGEY